MRRLWEDAHAAIRAVLAPGETAVDATAGNGHDTLFLAQHVGPTGRVYAFDTQADALTRTAALLESAGVTNATLLHRDHAEMTDAIPAAHQGRVGAVMFNLGYLPGGDQALTTRRVSTVAAVRAATGLLRPGGVLTVIAYPGHPGGAEEADAARAVLAELDASERRSDAPNGPVLYAVTR